MHCDCENDITTVPEDSTFLFRARVTKTDGTQLLTADIATITFGVYNDSTNAPVGTVATLTKTAVFHDAYLTPTSWTKVKDSTGFNFENATSVPAAGSIYRLEAFFTFNNGHTRKIKRYVKSI